MVRITLLVVLLVGWATMALAVSRNYVEQSEFRQWLENGKDMAVVDIQVPAEFQKHHFKGALETNAYPVKSPDDKQKLDKIMSQLAAAGNDVVVVCPRGGGGANNTYDYLKEKGIAESRIFILTDGMQGWTYKPLVVSGNN